MDKLDPEKRDRMNRATDAHLGVETTATEFSGVPAGWYPDKVMADTLRYWDGRAWTEHRSPLSGPPSNPPGSLAASTPFGTLGRDDASLAWILALLPILWLPFDYFAPAFSAHFLVIMGAIVLNCVLAHYDAERLSRRGVHVNAFWGWFVPVYLFQRTKRTGSTITIPAVWCIGAALSLLGAFTFTATYQLTDADMRYIERDLRRDVGIPVQVRCPDDVVSDGDRLWCTVSGGGESVDMTVDFTRSGTEFSFEWQVRG